MFFNPSDSDDLAEKMIDMIINWEEHSQAAKGIPSWDDIAGQMEDFYRSALGEQYR